MPEALIFLSASLFVFLILTEILTINIIRADTTVVEVNFMISAIRFTKKEKASNKRKQKRRVPIPPIGIIAAYLSRLASKSDIHIRSLVLSGSAPTPSAEALRSGIYNSAISVILGIIEENAKKFTAEHISISVSEHNKLQVDTKITISLLDLIICTVPFIKDVLVLKLRYTKGKWKHGRKQNERYDKSIT